MDYETVILKKENNIATIILNRPDRMNAMTDRLVKEVVSAIEDVENDPEMRVLVITGAGERAFCAGADIKGGKDSELAALEQDSPEATRQGGRQIQKLGRKLMDLQIPTIAMVNGVAVGGGMEIACLCDLRIGSEKARFLVAFTRLGLVPGQGGAWLYPRIMGIPKASEYIFTGDFIEAKEAERIGLLNRLVPADQLEKETMELAGRIAKQPPIGIKLAKIMLHKGQQLDYETILEFTAASIGIGTCSEDHKEGLAALREKREPKFKGR